MTLMSDAPKDDAARLVLTSFPGDAEDSAMHKESATSRRSINMVVVGR